MRKRVILFSIILLCVVLVSPSTLTSQTRPVGLISAPPNYEWVKSTESDAQILRLGLQNQKDKTKTKIQFGFDRDSEQLVEFDQNKDNKHRLYIRCFGCLLWEPHPGQEFSLEEKFIDIIGLDSHSWTLVQRDRNPFRWISFEQWLAEQDFALPDLDAIIEETQDQVERTRQDFLEILPSLLRQHLEAFDVVEAVASDDQGDLRMDAFSLMAIEALKREGEAFLDALEAATKRDDLYLVSWTLIYNKVDFKSRLAILSLITHNHESEALFLRAVAASFGLLKAWQAFKNINELYRYERLYWLNQSSTFEDPAFESYYSNPIDFFGARSAWLKVDMNLKANVLEPIFGFKSRQPSVEHLPFEQMYHFYGSLIVSLRMKRELHFEDWTTRQAAKALGIAYKAKTQGIHWAPLDLMSWYYSKGADQAIRLQALIRD